MSAPTVREIVKQYLVEHGFDGLAGDGCGCGVTDLISCDGDGLSCKPAKAFKCDGSCSGCGCSNGNESVTCYRVVPEKGKEGEANG